MPSTTKLCRVAIKDCYQLASLAGWAAALALAKLARPKLLRWASRLGVAIKDCYLHNKLCRGRKWVNYAGQ